MADWRVNAPLIYSSAAWVDGDVVHPEGLLDRIYDKCRG